MESLHCGATREQFPVARSNSSTAAQQNTGPPGGEMKSFAMAEISLQYKLYSAHFPNTRMFLWCWWVERRGGRLGAVGGTVESRESNYQLLCAVNMITAVCATRGDWYQSAVHHQTHSCWSLKISCATLQDKQTKTQSPKQLKLNSIKNVDAVPYYIFVTFKAYPNFGPLWSSHRLPGLQYCPHYIFSGTYRNCRL